MGARNQAFIDGGQKTRGASLGVRTSHKVNDLNRAISEVAIKNKQSLNSLGFTYSSQTTTFKIDFVEPSGGCFYVRGREIVEMAYEVYGGYMGAATTHGLQICRDASDTFEVVDDELYQIPAIAREDHGHDLKRVDPLQLPDPENEPTGSPTLIPAMRQEEGEESQFIRLDSPNRGAMRAYMKAYAYGANTPAYNYHEGADCANFVSQVLRAGGWSDKDGDYNSDAVWWHRHTGRRGNSRTWASANHLSKYLNHTARTKTLPGVNHGFVGDPIGMDFSNDGTKDHMMVVSRESERGSGVFYAAHTVPRFDAPFSNAVAANPGSSSKAWRVL